jgi:Flp pilus assembly protein TadG
MRRLCTVFQDLARSTSGTAVIETAIVATCLSIIIMGTVDLARYGAALLKTQQAVNRGLEMVMINGPGTSTSTVQSDVATQAGVATSAVTVTQTQTCAGTAATYGSTCTTGQEARKYYTINVATSFTPTFALGAVARRIAPNGSIPISTTGEIRVS